MGLQDWLFGRLLCGADTTEQDILVEYPDHVTPLYRAIERRQWASVNGFLKTGYWKNSYFADRLSPKEQVKTWVVRYDAYPEKGEINLKRVSWKQLPIHAAIIFAAPAIIIQKLMNLYPHALRCGDNRGNLPIHLAFRHGSNDAILAILLQEYPESMNCREANGLLPTECATELPSPQPLRGALLKTALKKTTIIGGNNTTVPGDLSNNTHDISNKGKPTQQQQEYVFGDERTEQVLSNVTEPSKEGEDKNQLSVLSKQMEELKTTVHKAFSANNHQNNAGVSSTTTTLAANNMGKLGLLQDKDKQQPSQQQKSQTSPTLPAKKTVDPMALESLRAMVSRALAGATESLQEPESDHNIDPHQQQQQQQQQQWSPLARQLSLLSQNMSYPLNSILESPKQSEQQQQEKAESRKAQTRNRNSGSKGSGCSGELESGSSLEKQKQAAKNKPKKSTNLSITTDTGDDDDDDDDDEKYQELRKLQEKMHQMERAMKEMHRREKTAQQELALTLKEVKRWKKQAKNAVMEEEKNRVLTEMLHDLVVPATSHKKISKHKSPKKNHDSDGTNRHSSPYKYRSPRALRKTRSEIPTPTPFFSHDDDDEEVEDDIIMDDRIDNFREYRLRRNKSLPRTTRHTDREGPPAPTRHSESFIMESNSGPVRKDRSEHGRAIRYVQDAKRYVAIEPSPRGPKKSNSNSKNKKKLQPSPRNSKHRHHETVRVEPTAIRPGNASRYYHVQPTQQNSNGVDPNMEPHGRRLEYNYRPPRTAISDSTTTDTEVDTMATTSNDFSVALTETVAAREHRGNKHRDKVDYHNDRVYARAARDPEVAVGSSKRRPVIISHSSADYTTSQYSDGSYY